MAKSAASPPYEPNDKHTEEQWYAYGPGNYMDVVPRYDQSIDLMVALVEKLPSQWDKTRIGNLFVLLIGYHLEVEDWINAPASLRLKAYRQVMGGGEAT